MTADCGERDKRDRAAPAPAPARRRIAPRARQRLALGTIAAASVGLAGCAERFDGEYAFTSVTECVGEGFDIAVCEGEFQSALTDHAVRAPRFPTLEDCTVTFGEESCVGMAEPTPSGSSHSVYMPFLTGYLVASALRPLGSYAAYNDYRAANPGYASGPIYRDAGGKPVTIGRGRRGATFLRPVDPEPRVVARGGFGGRGLRRGYGG